MKLNCLMTVLFLSKVIYSQENVSIDSLYRSYDVRYEVTIFGYTKIQLSGEGLMCKTYKQRRNGTQKEKIKFIRLKKLVKKLDTGWEIIDLFNYIHNAKLMELDKIEKPFSDSIPYYRDHYLPMGILFFDCYKGTCSYLEYEYYDEGVDKLLDMFGEIIPKKYGGKYFISGRPLKKKF